MADIERTGVSVEIGEVLTELEQAKTVLSVTQKGINGFTESELLNLLFVASYLLDCVTSGLDKLEKYILKYTPHELEESLYEYFAMRTGEVIEKEADAYA